MTSWPGAPKGPEIQAALRRRFPCQEIPWGQMEAIAAEFGVTREYVRQQADKLGIESVRRQKPRRICSCGNEIVGKRDLCPECVYVTLPCEECAAPVRRRASTLAQRMKYTTETPHGPAHYSGRVFCNRKCFGYWASRHFGFGTGWEAGTSQQA